MPAVTVVVAVYNSQPWLPRFFESLRRQTLKYFEVLMVDDASTDESAIMIKDTTAAAPRFRQVRLPVNSGAGAARNTGIREASGETICFAEPYSSRSEQTFAFHDALCCQRVFASIEKASRAFIPHTLQRGE